jgi:hypothetical protein
VERQHGCWDGMELSYKGERTWRCSAKAMGAKRSRAKARDGTDTTNAARQLDLDPRVAVFEVLRLTY